MNGRKVFAVTVLATGKKYKVYAVNDLSARLKLCDHLGVSFADKFFGIDQMESYEIKENNNGDKY